jgi:hypothetical protein
MQKAYLSAHFCSPMTRADALAASFSQSSAIVNIIFFNVFVGHLLGQDVGMLRLVGANVLSRSNEIQWA